MKLVEYQLKYCGAYKYKPDEYLSDTGNSLDYKVKLCVDKLKKYFAIPKKKCDLYISVHTTEVEDSAPVRLKCGVIDRYGWMSDVLQIHNGNRWCNETLFWFTLRTFKKLLRHSRNGTLYIRIEK